MDGAFVIGLNRTFSFHNLIDLNLLSGETKTGESLECRLAAAQGGRRVHCLITHATFRHEFGGHRAQRSSSWPDCFVLFHWRVRFARALSNRPTVYEGCLAEGEHGCISILCQIVSCVCLLQGVRSGLLGALAEASDFEARFHVGVVNDNLIDLRHINCEWLDST
jgi:hypothetical protein